MPRPNPPRKRPRRRPVAADRAAKAEVSLARQTAQSKDRSTPPEAKAQAKPKAKTLTKAPPPGPRMRRIDEPFVPWPKRSYGILVIVLAATELVIGAAAYFTLSGVKPDFWLYLLGLSYNPLIVLAAALVAAPVTKLITKESRSLRFMESVMVGIVQYFIWLALFVALTYAIGGFGSASPSTTNGTSSSTPTPLPTAAATPAPAQEFSPVPSPTPSASSGSTGTVIATPVAVSGLLVIDILSFVLTFYLYPPLYRRLRIRPPPPRQPRAPKEAKPKDTTANDLKSNVVRLDEAVADERKPKDPTPKDPTP